MRPRCYRHSQGHARETFRFHVKTASEIGQATLERLRAQAAANRAAGERLYDAVRAVWMQHPPYREASYQTSATASPERVHPSMPGTHETSTRSMWDAPLSFDRSPEVHRQSQAPTALDTECSGDTLRGQGYVGAYGVRRIG